MSRIPTARAVVLFASLLGAASLVTACSGTTEPVPPMAPLESPAGEWREVESDVFLRLEEGGTLVAFDGCNTLQGSWQTTDEDVAIQIDGGTERSCDDIPDVWLPLAETAQADDGGMVLFDASGAEIGELARADG